MAAELVKADASNARYHYNYACSLCCVGQCEEALVALEKAIELGMNSLREDGLRNMFEGITTIEEVLKYT